MRKFLLLSIVFATMIMPLLAARVRNPQRALRKTLLLLVAFSVFYFLAIRFLYSRLS